MDISAIVLNKILTTQDLDAWSKIKAAYLGPEYSQLYAAIGRHYNKYSKVPSFNDIEIEVARSGALSSIIEVIKLTECPDVAIEVAVDALIDQYTQNEAIKSLEKFVDKLPTLDALEIKEGIAAIVLELDEKTISNEKVFNMADLMIFQTEDEVMANAVALGFSNEFDAEIRVALGEYFLLGGKRGHGKSIICSNIHVSQYEDGLTCPYFTIEMSEMEVLQRDISILAGVDHGLLKKNKLSPADNLKVVQARADMFLDAQDLVDQYKVDLDRFKFEATLVREKQLKPDNQLMIIQDRELTLTSLDIHIGKLKAKFGDKMKVVVVDYINQIKLDGTNMYDWQPQVEVSKQLKNLAQKYEIVIFSPYQIDAGGEARFAKGILDSADIAMILEAHEKETGAITLGTTKIRGGREIEVTSSINWNTLRISPIGIEKPQKAEKKPKKKEKEDDTPVEEKPKDAGGNVPWD